MFNEKLRKAINEQINKEFYSSYLYLAMAAHFDANALPGFAGWMKVQASEEWGHGMRFYDYLTEVGATVELAVRSITGHTSYQVNQLRAGDVLDTQRRRRDKLVESYATSQYPLP